MWFLRGNQWLIGRSIKFLGKFTHYFSSWQRRASSNSRSRVIASEKIRIKHLSLSSTSLDLCKTVERILTTFRTSWWIVKDARECGKEFRDFGLAMPERSCLSRSQVFGIISTLCPFQPKLNLESESEIGKGFSTKKSSLNRDSSDVRRFLWIAARRENFVTGKNLRIRV